MDSYSRERVSSSKSERDYSRILRRSDESDDLKIDRKTRQLFDEWAMIEQRAEELRRETNRMRDVKDEAKRLVVQNFPHLFRDSNIRINHNSQDLSGGMSEASSTSMSSASSTSSGDNSSNSRQRHSLKNDKLLKRHTVKNDKIQKRLGLSKELRDVYEMLQQMNNLQSDDSSTRTDLLGHKRPWIQPDYFHSVDQFLEPKQDLKNGPLSQLLGKFQSENNRYFDEKKDNQETVQANKTMFQTPQLIPQGSAGPAYGFIPMPVDYETYCKWMSQFGPQGVTVASGMNGLPLQAVPQFPPSQQPDQNTQVVQPPMQPTHVNQHVDQAAAKPANPPAKLDNTKQHYLGDLEDGDDTSQDAADLVSSHDEVKIETAVKPINPKKQLSRPVSPKKQIIKLDNLEKPVTAVLQKVQPEVATKVVPQVEVTTDAHKTAATPVKPRSKLALPKSISKPAEPKIEETKIVQARPVKPIANPVKSGVDPPESNKLISKPKIEDDENFMIESDNVDENLYSSETTDSSDSTDTSSSSEAKKVASAKSANVQPKPKLRFSSSSSNSFVEPAKPVNMIQKKPANTVAKPVQAPLNLHSDSDSPEMKQKAASEAARPSNIVFATTQAAEDLDISGPENELDDDDFWN